MKYTCSIKSSKQAAAPLAFGQQKTCVPISRSPWCTIIYAFSIRYLCQNANEVAILGYVHLSYGSALKSRVLSHGNCVRELLPQRVCVFLFEPTARVVRSLPSLRECVCAHFPAAYQTAVVTATRSRVARSRSLARQPRKLSLSRWARTRTDFLASPFSSMRSVHRAEQFQFGCDTLRT